MTCTKPGNEKDVEGSSGRDVMNEKVGELGVHRPPKVDIKDSRSQCNLYFSGFKIITMRGIDMNIYHLFQLYLHSANPVTVVLTLLLAESDLSRARFR